MAWKGELIGSQVKIIEAKNSSLLGLEGKIIDETKNTITIENGKKRKIIKSHIILKMINK